jgi:hypothetical protein
MSILKKLEFEGGSKQQSIPIDIGDYPYYIRADDINRILDTTNEIINFVNTITYNSLINKPTINNIEIKGEISGLLKNTINQYIKNNDIVINWTDITNKSYNDLTNKPTITGKEIKGEISSYIIQIPGFGGGEVTPGVTNYNDLTNIPTINNNKIKGEISGLLKNTINQYIKDNDIVINWTDITNKSYNDLTNKPTINNTEINGEISGLITSIIPKAAEKLNKQITIALDGTIKGSAQFDGSSDITINTALASGITIDANMISRINYII